MTSEYSSDYLNRLIDAVSRFSESFESWMETQDELNHLEARGLFPTVSTREGVPDAVVKQRVLQVAQTAGVIARAVPITGTYIGVRGSGLIDPIANWSMMDEPKALVSPSDIRKAVATVTGRLKALSAEAEDRENNGAPSFGPFALHPTIWGAAVPYWTTGKYRVAVREAAESLNAQWKERLGRLDVDDTVFWQQTLSPGEPAPGKPKLVWPGEQDSKTNKSMRGGLPLLGRALNDLATGLNLTVRNVTTHALKELPEQEALERLGAYSYFARLLDQCEVQRAPE